MEVLEYPARKAFTVWYDRESGEIDHIDEGLYFQEENMLTRADVLKDAIEAFTELYAKALGGLAEWMEDQEAQRGK